MDFYKGLASGLGEQPTSRKVELFQQIQHAVSTLYHDQKITPVFILDEMQLAANKFLNDLSILFNFSMEKSLYLDPIRFALLYGQTIFKSEPVLKLLKQLL